MLDAQNILRGRCLKEDCDCPDFMSDAAGAVFSCLYCGHYAPVHAALQNLLGAARMDAPTTSKKESTDQEFEATGEVLVDDLTPVDQEDPLSTSSPSNQDIPGPSGSSASTHLFELPEFSKFVHPFLEGTAKPNEIFSMMDEFISEVICYLDSKNLLINISPVKQSWAYRHLQRAILVKYPNIIKIDSKRKNKPKGLLGPLMSRIAERRRYRKYVEAKQYRDSRAFDRPSEALCVLQCEKTFEKLSIHAVVRALRLSFPLREAQPNMISEKGFPNYLMLPKALMCEVELRLNSSLLHLEKVLKRTLKSLRNPKFGSVKALQSYLSDQQSIISLNEGVPSVLPPSQMLGPCIYMDDIALPGRAFLCLNNKQFIQFENISPEKIVVLLLGVYFIADLQYPKDYGQFLGFCQEVLTREQFPRQFQMEKLKDILSQLKND